MTLLLLQVLSYMEICNLLPFGIFFTVGGVYFFFCCEKKTAVTAPPITNTAPSKE